MAVKISVLVAYFLIILCIGFIARTKLKSPPETYFLADRQFGTLILLGTMVATNFSAFTVFGTSGAGYRDGYAFFPIMGFGTGFMALTFWILGRKIWELGKNHGIVTPPELVRSLYQSPTLSFIFASVMIIFTIPYLALQPMAAGYALEALIGLPYVYGCLLVTVIIVLYTLRGGLRAVAWTDMFQGLVMFVLLVASLIIVANHHGGFVEAHQKLFSSHPQLFSRPGVTGKIHLWHMVQLHHAVVLLRSHVPTALSALLHRQKSECHRQNHAVLPAHLHPGVLPAHLGGGHGTSVIS